MKQVAIYHIVNPNENFEKSAQILMELIQNAQKTHPDAPRVLYLDINGHRKPDGAFDADMWELQFEFVNNFLSPFLTEVHMPLIGYKTKEIQRNDIPQLSIS